MLQKQQKYITMQTMNKKQEIPFSAQKFLDRVGAQPETVDNLRQSQKQLKALGVTMSLEEIYNFEVGEPSEML